MSVGSECVRRCSRRLVHIEKLRILPSIHARAGNPDWKVTLENHTFGMGVFANFRKLAVEMELNEAVEIHIFAMLAAVFFNF